ncbi:MAG: ImmA/IrrE family metallo-endopeptidase [Clostridia bacterium]|nr:ImmA/IrrE family metallo-endopeptidase [Clostridia bacterium]
MRKQLGLDSSSPIDMFTLAQTIDRLTLVFYPMGPNLSGMCLKNSHGCCVIAINSLMTLGRQRFSFAHELFHLYYDDSMASVCSRHRGVSTLPEQKADAFASFFLMPQAELESRASLMVGQRKTGKLTLDDMIRLEQFFGISHLDAVQRLKFSNYLKSADAESFLAANVRRRAEEIGFSPYLYLPLPEEQRRKTYGYYIDLVQKNFNLGKISSGKYEKLLLDAFREDLVFYDEEDGDGID